MSYTMIDGRVAHKKSTISEWQKSELVLFSGELAFDELWRYKVGDGTKKWRELEYHDDITVIPVTGNIVVENKHFSKILNVTGQYSISLPKNPINGFHFYIKNSHTENIPIVPGSDTNVDGLKTDIILQPKAFVHLVSDGTSYLVLDSSSYSALNDVALIDEIQTSI